MSVLTLMEMVVLFALLSMCMCVCLYVCVCYVGIIAVSITMVYLAVSITMVEVKALQVLVNLAGHLTFGAVKLLLLNIKIHHLTNIMLSFPR